jgi:IclR family pca regulon transcriptional regulator
VAQLTGLARPTARRILVTLQDLGYVRVDEGQFSLTPKVIELGMAYIGGLGIWEAAQPHMRDLVSNTHESSSMSQLDGSDIVYVARVAVPKLISLRVQIGTRFPAQVTSQGKAILAFMNRSEVAAVLDTPSASTASPVAHPSRDEFYAELDQVRDQGYAVADQELAMGIRSISVPVEGPDGVVGAAMNTTVNAAETSVQTLVEDVLPHLRQAAEAVSRDWALMSIQPIATVMD